MFIYSRSGLSFVFSTHPPPSQHREVIQRFRAVLLNRHRHANRHPALGLIGGDADGFIGRNPRQATHILDIRRSEVLIRWCPLANNLPDRIEPILMIISTRKQIKRCAPTILQTLKLTETCIYLLGS